MKQFNNSKSHKGFTLLELIIVISVVAFLSTAGIASYINYNWSETLSAAAQDLAGTIQLAKSRSISQVQPSYCVDNVLSLDGYRINIPDLIQPEYTMSAICEEVAYDTKTFKLPTGVEFVSPPDTPATTIIPGEIQETGIFFPVITLGVQGDGVIVIKGRNNKKVQVSVDSVGTIAIKPL